jgi:uncharacterized protein involved in exopolysaccharide biosynthesis
MTMDFRFYLSLFLRRIHYFLILFALGSAIGLTLARVLPPVYLAEARLLVESEQIPGNLAASTVQTQATEQLQIIRQRILTRAQLLDMANELNIYAGTPTSQRMTADDIVTDLRDRINISTSGGGQGGQGQQATIVTVSFEAPEAQLSSAVTNKLVTLILQEDVQMRTGIAGQTLDFFVQEVDRLDKELSVLGAEILKFQEENLTSLPESLAFRRAQQATNQGRLQTLDRDDAALRDRLNRLVQLRASGGSLPTAQGTPLTPEQRQLQTLKDQLASSLTVLSPTNPKIPPLRAQIAALEKVVNEQLAGGALNAAGQQLSALDIQIADLEGQLKFNADVRADIEAEQEDLRISIEATPGNAIKLDTLNRDYAALRAQYDNAVANKARAETGDTIEALSKGQRISVIEQAVTPLEPTSPNRLAIAAGGVGGGLVLGLGLVFLLELMNSAIRRPVDLTAKLGITPFGTLPLLRSRAQIRRRRLVVAGAFAVVMVAIPAGLWVVHTQVTPLDLLLNRMLDRVGLAGLSVPGLPAVPVMRSV